MERALNQLLAKVTKTFGDRLVSVVLYGSAAVGDHHEGFSDLNVICVLQQISTRELEESESVFRWWREQKNPAPLLLSEHEFQTSSDCFAIEFHDIKSNHRILQGKDIVSNLVVDDSFYRAQVVVSGARIPAAEALEDSAEEIRAAAAPLVTGDGSRVARSGSPRLGVGIR